MKCVTPQTIMAHHNYVYLTNRFFRVIQKGRIVSLLVNLISIHPAGVVSYDPTDNDFQVEIIRL